MIQPKRVLSVFSLVMINVIAVDSLRTLPITAKLGLSLVSYYILAALFFFIPIALVAAELAACLPKTGGIYIWVREAFGRRAAFMTIWLQWIYNIVWYPTILAFIAATCAYLISPELGHNKTFLLSSILVLFWLFTFLNCFGMKVSSIVSTIGAIIGTLIPMFVIIILGGIWLYLGNPVKLDVHASIWPNFSDLGNLSLFPAVLFGLLGIEMSAVHAEEVKNPQKDYPKALLYSTIIIFATLVLGSLAIIIVVPVETLSIVSGLIDAYAFFFKAYHLSWMTNIIAALIIIGSLSGVSTWIIGPTKGLLISARDGCVPSIFSKVNKHGAPVPILIIQGLVFTVMSSVYILFDSINTAYWILSDLCAMLALLVYIFMFAAAIKIRKTHTHKFYSYRIPGGMKFLVTICTLGTLCCLFAIMVGFIPPTQIKIDNVFYFESLLSIGLFTFIAIPLWLARKNKP